MAVLTLPGADAVLAALAATLPQPDQLCGPFSARVALHAVLDPAEVPALTALAQAAGTTVWAEDVAAHRPEGAAWDRTGWEALPPAADPASSGTDAALLAAGITAATRGAVAVVLAAGTGADPGAVADLLVGVARAEVAIGVVANVRTGVLDPGTGWDVGHFVVLWAVDPDAGRVAVADTYPEVGAAGEPPGCRWVPVARLAAAVGAPPGRGLLLVVASEDAEVVTDLVRATGLAPTLWST